MRLSLRLSRSMPTCTVWLLAAFVQSNRWTWIMVMRNYVTDEDESIESDGIICSGDLRYFSFYAIVLGVYDIIFKKITRNTRIRGRSRTSDVASHYSICAFKQLKSRRILSGIRSRGGCNLEIKAIYECVRVSVARALNRLQGTQLARNNLQVLTNGGWTSIKPTRSFSN